MLAQPELLKEADQCSEEAMKNAPWFAFIKGTRGAVLIEKGEIEEGLRLAREAMKENEDLKAKAADACIIAMGEIKKGNLEEAKHYFAEARKLDADCYLLKRVEAMSQQYTPS